MTLDDEYFGCFRGGRIELEGAASLPEGTRVAVRPLTAGVSADIGEIGHVVVAGFGLAGRCVADLVSHSGGHCVIVERNPETVETQRALGREILLGDISEESIMEAVGIERADVLALTIPDEASVLRATELAKQMNPDIYIVARTTYVSSGIQAMQLGANEVVKSEQAVALQFHEHLRRWIHLQALSAK